MMARARAAAGDDAGVRRIAGHRCQQRRPHSPGAGTRSGAAARSGSRPRRPPSPATCRRRWAWRSASPAPAARRRDGLPAGRDRRLLVRRRLGQPRHSAVGHQHRALRRAHRPADADPVRLRGQRHRHLRADPGGLDRRHLRRPAVPAPTSLRLASSTRCGTRWARRSHTCAARGAGLPAPADRSPLGPRRQRRGATYRMRSGDRGHRVAGPVAAQRAPADRDWRRDARRAATWSRRRATASWPPPRRPRAGHG